MRISGYTQKKYYDNKIFMQLTQSFASIRHFNDVWAIFKDLLFF